MSACFQRLDGKPIDADVVYRYRLIDSIADGNAKNLRVQRSPPTPADHLRDRLARWLARRDRRPRGHPRNDQGRAQARTHHGQVHEPIRQVMRAVKEALDRQAELLQPVKPRVLFSALGERHAEQIAQIAEEHGIPCAHLHHSMTESHIKSMRARFEKESGDLQGIVQLRMLGQGYDFPPITVVVPMRPYASFGEFYQFVGRGIRVINHPALTGRVGPGEQFLDVIYHVGAGARRAHRHHLPRERHGPDRRTQSPRGVAACRERRAAAGTTGTDTAGKPEAFVLFEKGAIESRIVHDQERVDQRPEERALEALAQRYAKYAATSEDPLTFEQYVDVFKSLSDSP